VTAVTDYGDPSHRERWSGSLRVGGHRFQGDLVANEKSGALGLYDLPFLQVGKQPGDCFAGCPDHLSNFLVREGQFHTWLLLGSFSIPRTPFEQELSEFLSGEVRQTKRSHLVTGVVVFLAQLFSDFETRV
jgi:hypothetical protein